MPDVTEEIASPAPTWTAKRRERTRGRLLDAGSSLITEKGVAGLRIQEITQRAEVALGSFYNHFATKEDLVDAVVQESLASLANAVVGAAAEDDDAAVTVATAVRRYVRLAIEDPDFARLVVNLSHSDTVVIQAAHDAAISALLRGIKAGRFQVEDTDQTLTAVVGGALALMRGILDGRLDGDVDARFAEHVLRSLAVPVDEAHRLSRLPL